MTEREPRRELVAVEREGGGTEVVEVIEGTPVETSEARTKRLTEEAKRTEALKEDAEKLVKEAKVKEARKEQNRALVGGSASFVAIMMWKALKSPYTLMKWLDGKMGWNLFNHEEKKSGKK